MGKTLIITEKHSVAAEYAGVLGVTDKKDGYYENDDYVIAWCVGHLVTMCYPEEYDEELKNWKLETLPFIPENYRYKIIPDVAKQYKVLKQWMNAPQITTILYGGDSGREGEYIGRLVRQMSGVRSGIIERRIWIDSFTEDEILKGIREAKPLSVYDTLSDAAYERAIEDYATGINFTRALSCKYGRSYNQMIKSDKWKPLKVGRVMTCVMGMIVSREREIVNFTPKEFFRLAAIGKNVTFEWKTQEKSSVFNSPVLYNEKGFNKESDLNAFISNLPKQMTITDAKITTERKRASLLYNLAELQSDCSKLYKISPDKTLEVAQSLYEKKLTTYPRTDARVLSSAVAAEIDKNISGLKKVPGDIASFASETLQGTAWKGIGKTAYTDDSKITDHYAIIPTGNTSSLGALDQLEKNVYELICRRFLAIFYPEAVYSKVDLEGRVYNTPNEETFYVAEKILTSPGFMKVTGIKEKDAEEKQKQYEILKTFNKGDSFTVEYKPIRGETQPPKRYTSGSMILAMENAGNLIEDEELRAQIKGAGIGTSATRAEIIKKLVDVGYIKLDGKTQVLTPLPAGDLLYDIVAEVIPDLLSPKMTASWEKGLEQVRSGEITRQKYEETVNAYVIKGVNKIKESESKRFSGPAPAGAATTDLGIVCPFCGAPVRKFSYTDKKTNKKKSGFSCSTHTKDGGCSFTIFDSAFGKTLTDNQIKSLVNNKSTGKITFNKKDGSGTYDAKLKLVITNEGGTKRAEVKLDFDK